MLHARPPIRLSRTINNHLIYGPISFRPWHAHTYKRNLLTLAIETSCDDTAVAILQKDSPGDSVPNSPSSISSTTSSSTSTSTSPASSSESFTSTTHGQRTTAQLLFNEKITAPNTGLGGIHPLEALQSHQANLAKLVSKAIGFLPNISPSSSPSTNQPHKPGNKVLDYGNGMIKRLPDFISVTRGPGMRSNLHCGMDTAKGLATAWQVPLVGVHHMQAHALTPRLVDALEAGAEDHAAAIDKRQPNTDFPFLTLLVSGGHTMLLHSRGLTDHKILATTGDIAIGDALDKCGRMLLPDSIKTEAKDTAFAKHLSKFAFPEPETYHLYPVPRRRMHEIDKSKNEYGWMMQAPFADTRKMAFSFSSVASTVERILQERSGSPKSDVSLEERKALGRTAIGTAFEHLASRTIIALESLQSAGHPPVPTLVVSGGVAANSFLRFYLRAMLDVRGFEHVRLVFPPIWLCTDNAAMIAWCGMEMYEAGFRSALDIEARRKWNMDSGAEDGGIRGVGGWIRADHN